MQSHQIKFIKTLYQILLRANKPLSEYALLEILWNNHSINGFEDNERDSFTLFQMHFLLFHHLYLLRNILIKKEKYILMINCLKIELTNYIKDNNKNLGEYDYLSNYYLNLENLEQTTKEQVEKMISNFYTKIFQLDKKQEAIKYFDLPLNASKHEIKKRYHSLAKKFHPDLGGSKQEFQKLEEMASLLKI